MERKRNTLAIPYSTTFLSTRSDLLPMSSLLTPSEACRSISVSHPLTCSNDSVWQVTAWAYFCPQLKKMTITPRTSVGYIIHDYNTMGTPVVGLWNGAEPLLSCEMLWIWRKVWHDHKTDQLYPTIRHVSTQPHAKDNCYVQSATWTSFHPFLQYESWSPHQ